MVFLPIQQTYIFGLLVRIFRMVTAVSLLGIAKIKRFLTEGGESVIHAGDDRIRACEISE